MDSNYNSGRTSKHSLSQRHLDSPLQAGNQKAVSKCENQDKVSQIFSLKRVINKKIDSLSRSQHNRTTINST